MKRQEEQKTAHESEKLDVIQVLEREKSVLEAVRANLNDCQTLTDAKSVLDGFLSIVTAMQAVEQGGLESLLKKITKKAKTNPEEARRLFIHGETAFRIEGARPEPENETNTLKTAVVGKE